MEISNDTIGNRTRDLPACSAMTQPTALPRIFMQRDLERWRQSEKLYKMSYSRAAEPKYVEFGTEIAYIH
jgi:hypothetical protein